jgi:hypothetical protein
MSVKIGSASFRALPAILHNYLSHREKKDQEKERRMEVTIIAILDHRGVGGEDSLAMTLTA